MNQDLSEKIKQLRIERGVTQAALASIVGVSVQAVSKWECGGAPDVTLLPTIADFFEVSIDELFGRSQIDNNSIDNYLIRLMQATPESEQIYRASELCWAIFKGISGIPNIYHIPFTDTPNPDDDTCTRCTLCFDSGIAYVNARKDGPSILLMPEPAEGYNRILASSEELTTLFKYLADQDFFNTIIFLYSRIPISFSIEHISSSLKIPQPKMREILSRFSEFGWIEEEAVETEDGKIKIYKPVTNGAFIGFLYFATEITQKFKLWYMSNMQRKKSLLIKNKGLKKHSKKRKDKN